MSNQIASGSNSLALGNQVRIIIAADNQVGTAAQSEIYPIAGVGAVAKKSLPSGVTVTGGDYSSMADLHDYFGNVPMVITEVTMETSDTTNYENTVFAIGERMPSGQNPREKKLYLNNYQVSNGNGLRKSVTFSASDLADSPNGLILCPQNYMRFDGLKKNTSVTFYFKIAFVQRSIYNGEAVSF